MLRGLVHLAAVVLLCGATSGTQDAGTLVGVLTTPLVAAVLVTLSLWLLIADLTAGGIGIASGLAIAGFGLFFWAHVQAGQAGWGELALVAVGLALIVLELLVVPGFGVPGLLGLAAVLGGLFSAQLSDTATAAQVQAAALSVVGTLVAVLAGLVLMVRFLVRHGPPDTLVLDAALGSGEPVTERATGGWVRWFGGDDLVLDGAAGAARPLGWDNDPPYLTGHRGVTTSPLRPSGYAEIDGERIDVITAGEFIPAGAQVEVIDDTPYRRIVRRVADADAGEPAGTGT